MKNFIEVTLCEIEKKVSISVGNITLFGMLTDNATRIGLIDNQVYDVKESYKEIKQLIAEATK